MGYIFLTHPVYSQMLYVTNLVLLLSRSLIFVPIYDDGVITIDLLESVSLVTNSVDS